MSYLIFMVLAFAAAWATSRSMPRPFPLPPSQRLFVGLIGFASAAIAAKLPFLILNHDVLQHSGTLFASGKTILLGLVGGYAGVELAKWRLGIRTGTGRPLSPCRWQLGSASAGWDVSLAGVAMERRPVCRGASCFRQLMRLTRHPTQSLRDVISPDVWQRFYTSCFVPKLFQWSAV